MLKKLSHIGLATLLMVSTMGLSIQTHYCLGSFQYASLAFDLENCCGETGENPYSCCANVITHYQLDDDFQVYASLDILPLSFILNLPPEEKGILSTDLSGQTSLQDHAPPLLSLPLPALLQVWRI
ncbi:MAG: hypothetical protein AAFR61_01005 [Bacteroidota bacterium]